MSVRLRLTAACVAGLSLCGGASAGADRRIVALDGAPVATTRMACPGAALTAPHDAIVGCFADALTLAGATAGPSLVATAGTPPSIFDEVPAPHLGRAKPAGDPPYVAGFGMPGDLVIHAAPSPDAEAVTEAFAGQVLRNAGCDGDWCRVELPDGSASGWAELNYLEPADSALRAGQDIFDATGVVPCAKGAGAAMAQCVMGVARDGGGTATVIVRRRDGLERALFFRDGAFLSTDASQAGGGFDAAATHEEDMFLIRIDDERYEIVDAVVFGG